jgi:peptidoglycan/LPS O-acetylase OafA/YrhL
VTRSGVRSDSLLPPGSIANSASRLGYRPALDGVRGVCILAVLATHCSLAPYGAGFVGVDVFFVLSGFLITTLLVEEWQRFGDIRLKFFYARRALRLLPALGLLITVVILLTCIIKAWRPLLINVVYDGFFTLFYLSNWVHVLGYFNAGLLAHTWTLSIEEQFYLLWPLILKFALKRAASLTSIIRWLILSIALVVFWRMFLFCWYANEWRISRGTDTRADSLLAGCLVGIIFTSVKIPECSRLKYLVRYSGFLAVPLLVWFGYREPTLAVYICVVYPMVSLLAAVLIFELLLSGNGPLAWFFSRPWLVYLGRLSYGLYIWHFPIIRIVETQDFPRPKTVALELSLTAAATLLSFYLLERPILRYKRGNFSRI